MSTLSINGFARSSEHIRSTCCRANAGSGVELDVDHAPDAHASDLEAELPQRALNGLALRVEDPILRSHEDRCPHPRITSGSARYESNEIPVSRSNASTYRARVPATTSAGRSGPGGVLSQPVVSHQSRANCLSNDGCDFPGSYPSSGQKRDESGVSASSPRTRAPSGARPSSNFVSARMIPRASACADANSYSASEASFALR